MPHRASQHREAFFDKIADIGVAMVTTTETDGSLRARPMQPHWIAGDDEHLHFVTSLTSHKIEEVAANPHVNISFAKGGDFVSISGRAQVTTDPTLIEKLWSESERAWFPGGRTDPDLAILKVALDYGEYWDPPSANMQLAYGWTKAMLTGKSADGDLGADVKVGGLS